MQGYNSPAIGEDRATLGSDLSTPMVAYSMGRYPLWYRPLMTICWSPKCDKSIIFHVLNPTNFLGVEPFIDTPEQR